jgi:histidinol-phosphatase
MRDRPPPSAELTMHTIDDDLELAMRLADAARERSLFYFRRELQQWSKGDGSLATEADLAVEDELRGRLAVERPGDAVLGEERGQTGESTRCWIIDGIDGTIDFAAGDPDWGTLIALEIDGQVVLGVCDQPVHKRRYWAIRSGGAFFADDGATPTRLQSSTHADFATARSYLPPPHWVPDGISQAIGNALKAATRPEPQADHPAIQVALGSSEFAVFFLMGPWDIAAPALIVEEAGGRFSDFSGRFSIRSGSAVFSNGVVHDEILALVSSVRTST